jgi:hypothetical protein
MSRAATDQVILRVEAGAVGAVVLRGGVRIGIEIFEVVPGVPPVTDSPPS